jgi:hypothetical protein
VNITGPQAVPETSSYTYKTNCPAAAATWAITGPANPASGTGENLTITWGAGPALARISVTCGTKKPATYDVAVVQVIVSGTNVKLGGKAADGGISKTGVQLVDMRGPPPAVRFTASVQMIGPKGNWKGTVTTGFVQRLMKADSATWEAIFADNSSTPRQKVMHADTANVPPKIDYDALHSGSRQWYADDIRVGQFQNILSSTASMPKPASITISDSPGPGWWHQDEKNHGNLLLKEARAIWAFETYLCVRSEAEPEHLFRRMVAEWSIEVRFDAATKPPTITGIVSPKTLQRMNASVSADFGQCSFVGQSANDWLNDSVTFK